MDSSLYFVIAAGLLAMVFSFWKTNWISNQDQGTDRMRSIGQSISEGAMAFLRAEYRVLTIFVVLIATLLGFFNYNSENSSSLISLSFVTGAITSGLAGYLGMKVATKANNRTTNAPKKSLSSALKPNHFYSFLL